MAAKKHGRGGGGPPPRPHQLSPEGPPQAAAGGNVNEEKTVRENIQATSPYGLQPAGLQSTGSIGPVDGVTVIGEAVRRVTPECAEFLVEITTSSPTAAQAVRDNKLKTSQVANAVGPLGVQAADVQTISFQIHNLYSPLLQALPGYGGMSQIGSVGFAPQAQGAPVQPEVPYHPYDLQFGAYHARNIVRIQVREAGRVGEVADAAMKNGATILGGFSVRVADEAGARRAALEAAGKDARAKAETLASAAGKQLGDAIAIAEDVVACNGTYMAMRAAMPLAFGAGAPQTAGELEYYARVSARFGLT